MATSPLKSVEQICAGLAQQPGALAAVQNGRSQMPIAALLEHSFADVQAKLKVALTAAGLTTAGEEIISLRQLLLYALAARELGPYWGTLALSWLESGFPVDEEVAVALESLAHDRRFAQQARHRAFAIAKKWRHSLVNATAGLQS